MQACRSFSVAIRQHPRKRRHLGDPAAIIFAFGFDLEHGLYLAVAALPINAAKTCVPLRGPQARPPQGDGKRYRLALFFLASNISRSMEFPIARYPARFGCSLSPAPPVVLSGTNSAFSSPVAESSVALSKS